MHDGIPLRSGIQDALWHFLDILSVTPHTLYHSWAVSLRWTKLPPVRTGGREHAREVPYMRYGHTAVLIDDIIYIWGGRNDTEGACNVLYAFDVSKCPSQLVLFLGTLIYCSYMG